MRRVIARKLLLAVLSVSALAMPAHSAANDTPIAQAFNAAIGDMFNRFGPIEERRMPPSESDPQVSADLAAIRTAWTALGTADFPVSFPETMSTVCSPLNDLTKRYLVAGLNTADITGSNNLAAARNGYRYQSVVVPLFAFAYKCVALIMPDINAFWESLPEAERTPTRLAGIRKLRQGVIDMVLGAAHTPTEAGYTLANRRINADALAQFTGGLVAALTLEQRAWLLAEVNRSSPGLAKAWPKQYAKFRQALLNRTCQTLCQAG